MKIDSICVHVYKYPPPPPPPPPAHVDTHKTPGQFHILLILSLTISRIDGISLKKRTLPFLIYVYTGLSLALRVVHFLQLILSELSKPRLTVNHRTRPVGDARPSTPKRNPIIVILTEQSPP